MATGPKKKFLAQAREFWREFSASRPGRRFQERYRRRQNAIGRWRLIRRIFNITLGIILVALSAVGGLLPVLGWGTAIFGFALIAGEVLLAARLLDRAEYGLRGLPMMCRDVWDAANGLGRVLIVTLLVAVVAGLAYLVYIVLAALL